MQANGHSLYIPFTSEVFLERGEAGTIRFGMKSVPNLKEAFLTVYPEPKPPVKTQKGRETSLFDDPKYLQAMQDRSACSIDFMIIKSLELPKDGHYENDKLIGEHQWEFEKVKMSDPETYRNWEKELWDVGFSETETAKIANECLRVNGLGVQNIEDAKKDFLAGPGHRVVVVPSQCPSSEQDSTSPIGPVKDLGSTPPEGGKS